MAATPILNLARESIKLVLSGSAEQAEDKIKRDVSAGNNPVQKRAPHVLDQDPRTSANFDPTNIINIEENPEKGHELQLMNQKKHQLSLGHSDVPTLTLNQK